MRTALIVALVLVALLSGSAGAVAAADFCIARGTNTLVLKAFSLPSKGHCKDYRGFYVGGPFWGSGSACGSSDNTRITFTHMVISEIGNSVLTEKFYLSRSTLAGTGNECVVDTGGGGACFAASYARIACSPSTVPIPD